MSDSWRGFEYEHEETHVAWMGLHKSSHAANSLLQLFRSDWENPHPEWVIEEINIEALDDADSSYELFAITVE